MRKLVVWKMAPERRSVDNGPKAPQETTKEGRLSIGKALSCGNDGAIPHTTCGRRLGRFRWWS